MPRLLFIFGLLLCFLGAIPARAAVANAGSCSATATSCTLSATATGDLNVFYAYHAASATVPTVPAGYTKIGSFPASPTSTTGAAVLYCKIATSSGDTGSGTATNATAVAGLSYSGIASPSNLSASCAGMGVGAGTRNNGTSSTTTTFGALTLIGTSNWVAAFMGDSAGSTCTPGTLTSRSATGDVRALDTNATVSSWSSATCTVSSSAWISMTFVIQAPPSFPSASGPIMKRRWGFAGNSNTDTSNSITTHLELSTDARTAKSGDLLVVALKVPSTAGTITITDSTGGSNTWTNIFSNTDANSMVEAAYYSCLSATTTSVTIGLATASSNTQHEIFLIYNSACGSNPIDTHACAAVAAPATNFGSAIQSGSITPTVNNDMILQLLWEDTGGNIGLNNAAVAEAYGDGQWPLFEDVSAQAGGYAAQYSVQGTAAAINPGYTVVQTGTHDSFESCTVAIKQGSGGSAPGSGISVVGFRLVRWRHRPGGHHASDARWEHGGDFHGLGSVALFSCR